MNNLHMILPMVLVVYGCDGVEPANDAGPPGDVDAGASLSPDASADGGLRDDAGRPLDVDGGPGDPLVADAPAGRLRGLADGDVLAFLGIPYAESVSGPMRFTRPRPKAYLGDFEATTQGPGCPRAGSRGSGPAGEEDCLELNVWRPAGPTAPRPVMVFLHGGAFVTGTANDPLYDGADLAREGVVVVTIEYRIGVLGWLVSSELMAEDPEGLAGNYGLRDQMLALEWVQQNIAAFGGDPGNVTVFGESAGGNSVCALLGTPSAAGLFHRAVAQSAAGCHGRDRAESLDIGADLTAAAGCDAASSTLACMRSASVDALLGAADTVRGGLMGGPRLRPYADGAFLRMRSVASPAGVSVPLLSGSNLDEGAGFTGRSGVRTAADYRAYLLDQFGSRADGVAALYPLVPDSASRAQVSDVLAALWTDIGWRCPALEHAATQAALGAPAYLYEFRRGLSLGFGSSGPIAAHGYELFYLFNSFPASHTPDATDAAISADMQRLWVDFARSGQLDADVARFDQTAPRLVVDSPVGTDDARADVRRCADLAALGVRFGT